MPVVTGAKGASCVKALSATCTPTSSQQTRMCMSMLTPKMDGSTPPKSESPSAFVDPASDVARFLLTRGPFAFLGTSWVGCEPDNGVEGGGASQRPTHCVYPWLYIL